MQSETKPCCDDTCCTPAVENRLTEPSAEKLKQVVREKYSEIATRHADDPNASGCGCGCGTDLLMADSYANVEGYQPDADLGLGCGIPTAAVHIKQGDTVLDLGSGAGNDAFVARRIVGDSGRVIGVDMTQPMLDKANENNRKLGYTNVEFRFGEIENLPVATRSVDVVLSNCVLNLVPNKDAAFVEIFRVLKPGAEFAISDIVVKGDLPPSVRQSAELFAGCVSGAIGREDYLGIIKQTGFVGVQITKEKRIELPDAVLRDGLTDKEIAEYRTSGSALLSITVVGTKPAEPKKGSNETSISIFASWR